MRRRKREKKGSQAVFHVQLKENLTWKTWRDAINWDDSVENLLYELKQTFAQDFCADSEKPFYNILLTGCEKSGKSSFVNSIFSMLARRVMSIAEAGDSAERVFKKQYRMYNLRQYGLNPDPLPWRIGDTPGIVPREGENQVKNILQIVDGHVPDGYEFVPGKTFDSCCPGFINRPSSSSKIDCVAIVIDPSYQYKTLYEGRELLQSLRRGLKQRGIPVYAIVTKIDQACPKVQENLTKVYQSLTIRDLVSHISELLDFPVSNIIPVAIYEDQIELDHNIDLLLVHAFSKLIGAKERKYKNMKRKIADLVPVTKSGIKIPFYNIFLVGQIGSGKSSFFNGINAVLTNRMLTTKAEAGDMAESLTKEFRMYEIKAQEKDKVLSTRICDTFGLEEKADDDTDVRNLLSTIYGNVPDKYTFTDKEFHQDSPGYIASPSLENKAHCVCIAIDAEKISVMYDNVWRKLRSVCTAVTNRGIPAKILLMKIDRALDDNESIENINRNWKVRRLKQVVQQKIDCDIEEEDIFPIKNYVKEVEFDVDMDSLLLDSLLHMLKCAEEYLECK